MQEKREKLTAKNQQSVELQVGAAELEQLQEIAADMNMKLEQLDVEGVAPARIRRIQRAIPAPAISATTAAQADVAGVEAIGGLVVVDAGRDGREVGQAQTGGHQQGQGHKGQRVVARQAVHMEGDCSLERVQRQGRGIIPLGLTNRPVVVDDRTRAAARRPITGDRNLYHFLGKF